MDLLEKIKTRRAHVAVIGLGYVGLPLAVEIAKAGFHVVGIEQRSERVRAVNEERSYIADVDAVALGDIVRAGRLEATTAYEVLGEIDVLSICVPTPLGKGRAPDTSFIENALDGSLRFLKPNQLLILESTTYPGTTEEIIVPRIKEKGLVVGEDFFVVYSPERVDPGNKLFGPANTPKIIGGVTTRCAVMGEAFYRQFVTSELYVVSSPKVAETEKLFENVFRVVNISLVNELAMLCERMGIDVWEVIGAASTKPFGFMPFYPGPGLGGHCIPLDPYYLSWKARQHGFTTQFIELAGEIAERMPRHVVSNLGDILNRERKALNGSRILIVGIAYKRDVDDVRESPAITLAELLLAKGAILSYHDPFVSRVRIGGEDYHSGPLTAETIKAVDLVLVVTDHTCIDYELISQNAHLVYDSRNALSSFESDKIFKLGGGK